MKRILFVDDEPQILDGLRDLLRKQRKQWDMVFALGGEAALAELDRGRFDVVVSDMRMPGMDGAALLQKIKEQYPTTARIILSGHAEREAVVNALLSVDAPPDPSVGGRLNVAFVESSVFGSELSRWRTLAEEERGAASRES